MGQTEKKRGKKVSARENNPFLPITAQVHNKKSYFGFELTFFSQCFFSMWEQQEVEEREELLVEKGK